jgi:hypothetical protein
MGQDREFTEDEKLIALRTVRDYMGHWKDTEKENLEQDILKRLDSIPRDKEYKDHFESQDLQELERKVEQSLMPKEGEEPLDEDIRT